MQAIGSVMNIGMNGLLSSFAEGNAAVNVLNVYFKLLDLKTNKKLPVIVDLCLPLASIYLHIFLLQLCP